MGLGWSEAFVWVPQQSGALMDTERPMGEGKGAWAVLGPWHEALEGSLGRGPA